MKVVNLENSMKKEIIYYSDELNDEFAGDSIVAKKIDKNYVYIHKSLFKKFTHFFWYRIIAYPLAYLYLKIVYHHKIVNRKVLKKYKKTGYFIYGNHTHNIGDALIPTMVNSTKDTYVIVHPNNVSMPVLGKITPSIGAIPLPGDIESTRNFMDCLKYRLEHKCAIMIYPEAHIWPYYTKIRPFKDQSFRYPVNYNVPTFTLTNVYKKRKISKKPKIVTYIDGPFFPNEESSASDKRKELRDLCYNQMVLRSKENNVEIIKYVKKESE